MDKNMFGILLVILLVIITGNIINEILFQNIRNDITIDEKVSIMHAQEIAKLNQTINQLNQTINEIDNRTTTNNPVTITSNQVHGVLNQIITDCIETQGIHSKVCQAELKIDSLALVYPTEIETQYNHYGYSSDQSTWCYLKTGDNRFNFIIDLNSTEYQEKCHALWSTIK